MICELTSEYLTCHFYRQPSGLPENNRGKQCAHEHSDRHGQEMECHGLSRFSSS